MSPENTTEIVARSEADQKKLGSYLSMGRRIFDAAGRLTQSLIGHLN
jgi:hypothetical protein